MADSSSIDNAVIAKLLADATLTALVPDGVYWEETPPNKTRYVVVSLVNPTDARMFGGRAYEANVYMIKAVMRSDSGGNIQSAAARIDALLEGGTLTISGYSLMTMQRWPDVSRIRQTERDGANSAFLWEHRGGYYEVWASS